MDHRLAAEVDLHNLNTHTATAALIVWLRFVKFQLRENGGRQPFGEDRHLAYIVTGAMT